MNTLCRSVAQRAFAKERLPSLQSYHHYYSTAAAKPRYRATKTMTSQRSPPSSPPSPPEQTTYTLSSPSRGAKAAQSSASSFLSSSEVILKRPSEIPFQAKVANSVQLIGYIPKPVHFQTTHDGKPWASTTITTQRPSSTSTDSALWIPIIFEGDLAHIAACHVKENDYVYITGQLSKHHPWRNANQGEASVQVMVQNLNFVEASSPMVKDSVHNIEEEVTSCDSDSGKEDGDTALSPWRDLLDNPKEWSDYRSKKRDGLVKPKYPDFKRKDGSQAIWLNSAPKWVLSKLEGLEFGNQIKNSKGTKQSKDVLWKDLVDNPDKWWDNRQDKFKESQPDFKHKENGEVLWLNSSPAWALSKLPPPRPPRKAVATGKRETLPS
ncbi:protein OSB2, chloroplastic [Ziziphus jujuba]|uniref:Protein OSB2, chloroplastic n=1 Tax=Ziziphus jujuba TaxID=326968 RepID=A0ABM3IX73_ZIZJJ|nr:protein OSB2, chloroplastic [Ziziphus jujuba]